MARWKSLMTLVRTASGMGRGRSLTVMDGEWGERSTHFQKFLSQERARLSMFREVRKGPAAPWSPRQTL